MESPKTKKTIALFIMSFRAGGGERVMVDIANAIAEEGQYQVDLLVVKPVGQYATQVHEKVNVVSLDAGRIIFSLPKLISYLRRERPEALMALDEYTHVLALVAKMFARVDTRIILRVGNMYSVLYKNYKRLRDKIVPFISRRIYKKADAIIAVSEGVKADVIKLFSIKPERIIVIPNPKDIEMIREKAKEPVEDIPSDLPLIVSVGRLRVQKNFPILIEAFAKVLREVPSRLVLVGTGREEQRLREFATKQGLSDDAIIFTGFQDNPYKYMMQASVYVLSSLWEGLPNSLIEAMVCGAPVVAADCDSGPREILAPDTDPLKRIKEGVEHAEYGILVPVGSVEDTAEALKQMLRDEGLRGKYTEKSLERSEAFEHHAILKRYEQVMIGL
jgi:glycosyltransferase involved in cell wall biosynthesis